MLKLLLTGILMLFSAVLAADQPALLINDDLGGAEAKIEVTIATQEIASKAPLEQEDHDTETSTVERFVQPFTRWAEDLIHGSSIVRTPELNASGNNQSGNSQLTLRSAIKLAVQRYPGTVLNIEKIETDGQLSFDVNIISNQGVVRTIRIAESNSGLGER